MLNRKAKTILAAAILLATTIALTSCNNHLCTAIGCSNPNGEECGPGCYGAQVSAIATAL